MKALNQATAFSLNTSKNTFSKADLENCADGLLFGPGNAQLPSGPLLMIDRVVDMQSDGGQYDRGYAIAELDIDPATWFFKHHFQGDPIMPGCLQIESLWQLTGLHMAWSGYEGKGRVLESGKTRFVSPVEELKQTLTISIHVRKIIMSDADAIYIANGDVKANEDLKCRSDAIKVGIFN